jgi:hypothetical protein
VTTTATQPDRAALEASRSLMEDNLRLLHDVLARTPIAGRYWLFGGLLLSAIREGEIMLHDTKDADWAFLAEDEHRMVAAFPALLEAGFEPYLRFPAATGQATEYSFMKDDAKFEFFRVEVVEDRLQWHNYGRLADGTPLRNTCAIPAQPLDEIRFLDRTWLKVQDVDRELTALYDTWRIPAPGFNYMEAPTIIGRDPWDREPGEGITYIDWPQVFPVTGC